MLLALTIACFITASPSPYVFIVGGPKADIEVIEAMISKSPGARVLDRAMGAGWGFAHVELTGETRYGDFLALTHALGARRLLYSPFKLVVPRCERDGRAEEIEVAWAPPVIVGIFGGPKTLAGLRGQVSWATISDLELPDGRRGVMFRPRREDDARYETFLADVYAGRFGEAEIVLLEEAR